MKPKLIKFCVAAAIVVAALIFGQSTGWSQSTWEGPTGVFLNPLALTLPASKGRASVHFLDLQPAGALTSIGSAYGFGGGWEAGITRADLSVAGSTNTNILHAKKIVLPFKDGLPQVAVGVILRDTHPGGPSTNDFYIVATKVFSTSTPIITSLTVRNTNGLGSGLFGKTSSRHTEVGGFLGFQVRENLCLGVEYYGQPQTGPWKDICFRWQVGSNTFVDGGLADLNDTFDNQLACGLTHEW